MDPKEKTDQMASDRGSNQEQSSLMTECAGDGKNINVL